MEPTIFKILVGFISAGVIATPIFVVDRISAQAKEAQQLYATKDRVNDMCGHLDEIKAQQKRDHDILIRISYKLGIKE